MAAVTETVHLAFRVPAELAEALSDIAERNDRSASAELRIALKAHVERNTAQPDRKTA